MRAADPPLRGLRILVVGDDHDSLDILQQALEFFGARVTAVDNAQEARRRLESAQLDVLVADIELGHETGTELLTWLRARPNTRVSRIPAVAITAHRHYAETKSARSFADWLLKPVRADDLCAAVARAASSKVGAPTWPPHPPTFGAPRQSRGAPLD
jgi:CheY-like chemotaxis protein